jgi:DNA modification methylase
MTESASDLRLMLGDCLERLREMEDCSVDSVVTDPPYGLSFMGKKWDYDVPSEDIWRECLRVLKPGGHLLAFAGTRTQHRMAVRIEDAGFEIRDMIAWVYGSGFPKSHNLKDGWDGWGTALKPALEPITVARKPLGEKTVAANVLAHGTGAINVDGCRVGTEEIRRAETQSSGG